MWSSRLLQRLGFVSCICVTGTLSACTVEPLNATRPDSAVATGNASDSIGRKLASTEVAPTNSRVGQQVRNALLFAMNGGKQQPGGQYKVNLEVTSIARTLSIEASAKAPTSAQVEVKVAYSMIDKTDNSIIDSGKRSSIAAYDRTPQNFANQRAQRDAENRAAKEVAQQIRLALGQALAGQ